MLIDAIREFVTLSGQFGVKGSNSRVRALMVVLRRSGFTSSQIHELSGRKWSSTLIRQYTGDWGGVDDSLTLQRKSLMTSLRELASSNMSVGDFQVFKELNRLVRAKGSNIVEVAELNSNLKELDLQPGEIGELVTLSKELSEGFLTPGAVLRWIALDQELTAEGLSKNVRQLLLEVSKKYGGVEKFLQTLIVSDNLERLKGERSRLEADIELLKSQVNGLRNEKEKLDFEIFQKRELITVSNAIMLLGFDAGSLSLISTLSEDLGGPYEVVKAVHKYGSLKDIDVTIDAKKTELKKVNKEVSNKGAFLNVLNYSLEEAKKEYYRNSDVSLVVNLLLNPRGIEQDRIELSRLLARVLDSGAQRMEESLIPPSLPSPIWDAIHKDIKALAKRLRSISDMKAEGL